MPYKIKKNLFVLCLLVAVDCNSQTNTNHWYLQIDSLLSHKAYFAARDLYASHRSFITRQQQLITEATLDHVFNRLTSSNQKIEQLFRNYTNSLPDSVKCKLLITKQSNHGKLYEYQKAAEVIDVLLKQYALQISKEEKEDFENTEKIWKSLAGQPKQKIIVTKTTHLKFIRDKAGLANLTVTKNTDSTQFIFDTGANISTVTESVAKQMGMKFMEGVIDVTAITGKNVKSRIAVCPELRIGDMNVYNAVFLVFPDEALSIKAIQYQIHGILGFPVIEALKEIQITKNDELIIPIKPSKTSLQNMALDFLTPVLNINGDSYTFDTGADKTILYAPYFNKYKSSIEHKSEERLLGFGGAGGSITKKGYIIPFMPVINGKSINISSTQLFKESIRPEDKYYFGNIGQDVIRKFDKMVLNFESMSILFE